MLKFVKSLKKTEDNSCIFRKFRDSMYSDSSVLYSVYSFASLGIDRSGWQIDSRSLRPVAHCDSLRETLEEIRMSFHLVGGILQAGVDLLRQGPTIWRARNSSSAHRLGRNLTCLPLIETCLYTQSCTPTFSSGSLTSPPSHNDAVGSSKKDAVSCYF